MPKNSLSKPALNYLRTKALRRKIQMRRLVSPDYVPYGAITKLFKSDADEVLVDGPAGTGKSRGTLEYLHRMLAQHPKSRALLVRKTRASLTESGLVTYEEKVLGGTENPILNVPARYPPDRKFRSSYKYPNGSVLVVGGLDNADRVLSTEYDMILVQQAEEIDVDAAEKLTTRLRNGRMPVQQIIYDANPSHSHHWLILKAHQAEQKKLKSFARFPSRHEDNPVMWDMVEKKWTEAGSKYIAFLDRLTGARKERLRFGRWVSAEGVVYDTFDENVHVIEPFAIPGDWRFILVVDFGYTNPFVAGLFAIDHDGTMYLVREIYMSGRTVRQHVRGRKGHPEEFTIDDMLSLGWEGGKYTTNRKAKEKRIVHLEAVIADWDAEDRATLSEEGFESEQAFKSITVGIQQVTERLRFRETGKARLYFFKDALMEADDALPLGAPRSTVQEFDTYIWPKDVEGKALKEVPVKLNDHGMDMTRYAVCYVDGLGGETATVVAGANPLDDLDNMR